MATSYMGGPAVSGESLMSDVQVGVGALPLSQMGLSKLGKDFSGHQQLLNT